MTKNAIPAMAAIAVTLAACTPATPPVAASIAVTDTRDYGPAEVNAVPVAPVTARIAYGSASARQFGELRVPKGKGPFPLAVIWHGGCWTGMGSTANVAPLASFLAQNGVAVWAPSYRELGSDGGWPNTFTDWAQGLSFVKTLAQDYPLDLSRITLMGHSAGVTPAMWLASGNKGDPVIADDLPRVRGIVALDGPLVLAPLVGMDAMICGQPVIAPLVGGTPEQQPDRFAIFDPRANRPEAERLLVIDAALPDPDLAVLEALRAQGLKVDVISLDQQQHFNLLVPGTRDFAAMAPALLDIARAR